MAEIKISSEGKLSDPEKQIIAMMFGYCRFDEEFFYPELGFLR